MDGDTDWFDKKYAGKNLQPTVRDVLELMREVCEEIKLPRRQIDKLENMLDDALIKLGREAYSLKNEIRTYYLLIIACPLSDISREKREQYLERYGQALDKSKEKFFRHAID